MVPVSWNRSNFGQICATTFDRSSVNALMPCARALRARPETFLILLFRSTGDMRRWRTEEWSMVIKCACFIGGIQSAEKGGGEKGDRCCGSSEMRKVQSEGKGWSILWNEEG